MARRQLEPASNSLDKELKELFSHHQDYYGADWPPMIALVKDLASAAISAILDLQIIWRTYFARKGPTEL